MTDKIQTAHQTGDGDTPAVNPEIEREFGLDALRMQPRVNTPISSTTTSPAPLPSPGSSPHRSAAPSATTIPKIGGGEKLATSPPHARAQGVVMAVLWFSSVVVLLVGWVMVFGSPDGVAGELASMLDPVTRLSLRAALAHFGFLMIMRGVVGLWLGFKDSSTELGVAVALAIAAWQFGAAGPLL